MAPSSKNPNPDKDSGDDRTRRKKTKSKSKSAKRRRRDPSLSPPDSDSDLDSRSRRKSSKSKKRRREIKRSEKRRGRNKRRRRDASVSSFSGDSSRTVGCSTCSESDRSRSPVRKRSKARRRERERGRKGSRRYRDRSPSCSSCSGGSSRSRSPIKDRRRSGHGRSPAEERDCRSRSRSSMDGRFGRSHELSPAEQRYGGSHEMNPIEQRYGGGTEQNPIYDRYDSRCHEESLIDDRYGSNRGPGPTDEIYGVEGKGRRLRSVVAATTLLDGGGDVIIKTSDDSCASGGDVSYDAGGGKKELYDTPRSPPAKSSGIVDDVSGSNKDCAMRKEDDVAGEGGAKEAEDLELILRQKALENFKKFRGGNLLKREPPRNENDAESKLETNGGVQNVVNSSEVVHSSYLGEQRVVQQGAIDDVLKAGSTTNVPTRDPKGESSISSKNIWNRLNMTGESDNKISANRTPLTKDNQLKKVVTQPDSVRVSGAEADTAGRSTAGAVNAGNQRVVQQEAFSDELKAGSITNVPTRDDKGESSISRKNIRNRLSTREESDTKISANQTPMAKDNQLMKVVTQPDRVKVGGAQADTTARSTVGAINSANQNKPQNDPRVESDSGGQFEKKTFARVRDGETVQVSYKVYIPKKTPALARRQLQR